MRILTIYVSSHNGASTMTPMISKPSRPIHSVADMLIAVATGRLSWRASGTRKTLWTNTKHDGGANGDRQPSKDRIDDRQRVDADAEKSGLAEGQRTAIAPIRCRQ